MYRTRTGISSSSPNPSFEIVSELAGIALADISKTIGELKAAAQAVKSTMVKKSAHLVKPLEANFLKWFSMSFASLSLGNGTSGIGLSKAYVRHIVSSSPLDIFARKGLTLQSGSQPSLTSKKKS